MSIMFDNDPTERFSTSAFDQNFSTSAYDPNYILNANSNSAILSVHMDGYALGITTANYQDISSLGDSSFNFGVSCGPCLIKSTSNEDRIGGNRNWFD